MIARTRRLFLLVPLFAVAQVVSARAEPAGDAPEPPSEEAISAWIADLDSNDFSNREEATVQLITAGAAGVKPLCAAAEQGSPEVAVRTIRVLQALYTAEDGNAVDAAEEALEKLARAENGSLATRAALVLELHDDVRQRRAVAKIMELGGVVKYLDSRFVAQRIPANQFDEDEHSIDVLILSAEWRGGDDGLKYVKRLNQLRSLLVVRGAEVSQKGLEALQSNFPNLQIEQRGPAYLGVQLSQVPRGCRVSQVTDGSAAMKAGLQENDFVLSFGDKSVTKPEDLIELISKHKPGDKVPIVVDRGGRSMTLEVVMGSWADD